MIRILLLLAALLILLAIACQDEARKASPIVTVYRSSTCACCGQYETYLEAKGFDVESIMTEHGARIKDEFAIPIDMRSCHTAMVSDYFVEGHVPAEAIWKLLEQRPEIDGIALPGMPAGSPGMGGDKEQPLMIYSIVAGQVDEFMAF